MKQKSSRVPGSDSRLPASVYPLEKWGCKGSVWGSKPVFARGGVPHPDSAGSGRSPAASQPFLEGTF